MKADTLWAVNCVVSQVFSNGVTLKEKVLRWFEVSVATRLTLQRHIPEGLYIQQDRSKNLKFVMSADAVQAINHRLL